MSTTSISIGLRLQEDTLIRLSKEVFVYSKEIEPAQLVIESSRLPSPEKQASAEGSGPTVYFSGPVVVPRSPSCSGTNKRLVILFWAGVELGLERACLSIHKALGLIFSTAKTQCGHAYWKPQGCPGRGKRIRKLKVVLNNIELEAQM